MSHFSDLNLKYLDARSELLYSPELIEEGFIDVAQRSKHLLQPEKFIVFGPKGSGKTAIGAYLELSARAKADQFVKLDELDDFDFNVVTPERDLEGTYPVGVGAWKFLLSLRLLALMQEDLDLLGRNPALVVLKDDLERVGLLPSPNVAALARETFQNKPAGRFKFLLELNGENNSNQEWASKKPIVCLI